MQIKGIAQNSCWARLDAHSQRGTESHDTDAVWVSDTGANAILRFDPKAERF